MDAYFGYPGPIFIGQFLQGLEQNIYALVAMPTPEEGQSIRGRRRQFCPLIPRQVPSTGQEIARQTTQSFDIAAELQAVGIAAVSTF